MAIIARWRMPPENSCGYISMRRSASGMRTCSSIAVAWRTASAPPMPRCLTRTSVNCLPTRMIGIQRRHRILEDHGHDAAADLVQLVGRKIEDLLAAQLDAAAWRGRSPPAGPSSTSGSGSCPSRTRRRFPRISPGAQAEPDVGHRLYGPGRRGTHGEALHFQQRRGKSRRLHFSGSLGRKHRADHRQCN